jgi:hypothetical protein
MRSNGSAYVSIVVAALAGYFVYQWWFNPNRIIKQRLGDVAATLSAPANEQPVARLARVAQLRRYADEKVRVTMGRSQYSRDEALGAVAAWQIPPGGVSVDFADVDVRVNPDGSARAFATAQMTTKDVQTQQPESLGSVEVVFSLTKQSGDWLIDAADVKQQQQER